MTQNEITKWERENFVSIIGWEVEYGNEKDIITFKMIDGTKNIFERIKMGV